MQSLVGILRQLTLMEVMMVLHYATVKLARRGLATIGDVFLIDRLEDGGIQHAA